MSQLEPCVWVAGATGLVGRALLAELRHLPGSIEVLLRRPVHDLNLDLPSGAKLHKHQVDFSKSELGNSGLPKPDAVYICLGTTIAAAGSQAGFRAVDLDAVLNVARLARAAGARRCAVVSALGADPHSPAFYSRIKGEAEQQLIALRFDQLLIARPSLLIAERGRRAQLGQAERRGEAWALALTKPFRSLIPAKWRPIEAERVARAMILALGQDGPALRVLESAQLQTLGSP